MQRTGKARKAFAREFMKNQMENDKTKKEIPLGISFFVVRSTGICLLGRASKRRQFSYILPFAVCGRFSREPAYNYAVRATIYDKTKIGCSHEHPIFVVRSTGIEPRTQSLNPL